MGYKDLIVSPTAISEGEAVSKNSVSASIRFARDSSIEAVSRWAAL